MKKLLFSLLVACSLIQLVSCHKFVIIIPPPPPPVAIDSTTHLLTGQTWVYYEYFTNFDPNPTTLVWKTNRTNNIRNYSLNQVKFNADSTYSEIDQNGILYQGTWSWQDNKKGLKVVNSQGTFTSTLQSLSATRFEWKSTAGDTYAVMIPRGSDTAATGDKTAMITGKNWIYTEYFWNWDDAGPVLVWKPNKTNSPNNLSLNVVRYAPDGTYTETDQNGVVYNGTWAFLNNQTQIQVINSLGVFTSTIKRLDAGHFEWWENSTGHYGEMMPR